MGRSGAPRTRCTPEPTRAGGVEAPPEPSDADRLLEELEHTRLLTDGEAWRVAGEELRRRDPTRYVAILRVVEEICQIHRSPLAPADAFPRVIPRSSDGDDFD